MKNEEEKNRLECLPMKTVECLLETCLIAKLHLKRIKDKFKIPYFFFSKGFFDYVVDYKIIINITQMYKEILICTIFIFQFCRLFLYYLTTQRTANLIFAQPGKKYHK